MDKKKVKLEVVPDFESQCEYCIWYDGNKTCSAFRNGIPERIWKGTHDKIEEGQDFKVKFNPEGDIL